MPPDDASLAWLARHDVPRETITRIEAFCGLLQREGETQNLIARSTLEQVWQRHVIDSAQLLDHAPAVGRWLDLGSGAGFPGLIVAAIGRRPVTLVESRAKRIAFLRQASALLAIESLIAIEGRRLETIAPTPFDIVSARAFAPLPRLLTLATPFATTETCWLLPKGRSAHAELDAIAASWQGDFRLVPSITDADAAIIVATAVRPRMRRR